MPDRDANAKKKQTQEIIQTCLPPMELIQQQLGSAKSMDDFFGKEGILSGVFGHTLEKLLEAELTDHLGYDKTNMKLQAATAATLAMAKPAGKSAPALARPK